MATYLVEQRDWDRPRHVEVIWTMWTTMVRFWRKGANYDSPLLLAFSAANVLIVNGIINTRCKDQLRPGDLALVVFDPALWLGQNPELLPGYRQAFRVIQEDNGRLALKRIREPAWMGTIGKEVPRTLQILDPFTGELRPKIWK